jgi:hypothetical protein
MVDMGTAFQSCWNHFAAAVPSSFRPWRAALGVLP